MNGRATVRCPRCNSRILVDVTLAGAGATTYIEQRSCGHAITPELDRAVREAAIEAVRARTPEGRRTMHTP